MSTDFSEGRKEASLKEASGAGFKTVLISA
jgi:hypothetical protein